MKYSVYQHWDPLKVCIVGKSYPPEFYSFITNSRVRRVMERIAQETEEDYQTLIKLLESFGVEVLRPTLDRTSEEYIDINPGRIPPPPMTPRDYSMMLGTDFFFKTISRQTIENFWGVCSGSDWPSLYEMDYKTIAKCKPEIVNEINSSLMNAFGINISNIDRIIKNDTLTFSDSISRIDSGGIWESVISKISQSNNIVRYGPPAFFDFSAARNTRIGKDVYLGTDMYGEDKSADLKIIRQHYPEYRWHVVDTGGHSDGTFCPVVPGLIVSLHDVPTYKDTFPGWEVIYLPGQSWNKMTLFLKLKEKNRGKWWVPGEELNDDFTNFVESWLNHWVGYVEETVFDVNMLVIDEKNVVVNNYNEQVFRAFERYGITPHIINFRHRYFWDGGLHCITSDVHREGTIKDYFPERG